MAAISGPGGSTDGWFSRLRGMNMLDWIKTGLSLAGLAVLLWASVQQHGFRLDQIEETLQKHLENHESQNKELQATLLKIQLDLRDLANQERSR